MNKNISIRTSLRNLLEYLYTLLRIQKVKPYATTNKNFTSSQDYWEQRYLQGGTSGAGSYGVLAEFKAEVINSLLLEHSILTAIEFGCGDGSQLKKIKYPSYIGYDVSPTAIQKCKNIFRDDKSKEFHFGSEHHGGKSDMTLSLDVIYHLVEDEIFEKYMTTLFGTARKLVVIYSSNENNSGNGSKHVRHRKFTDWVEQNISEWSLIKKIPNKHPYQGNGTKGSFADFFIYTQRSANS